MPLILYLIGAASFLAAGALLAYSRHSGDCETVLEVHKSHDFRVEIVDGHTAVASCVVPLANKSQVRGTVVDLRCEVRCPRRVETGLTLRPFAARQGEAPSGEGWRATDLAGGQSVDLVVGVVLICGGRATARHWPQYLARLSGLPLLVRVKVVGRRSIAWRLSQVAFPWEDLARKAA
ncbi:MAG: hypothetical protein C4551_07580 [Bacillota bacterium]|nr:MAG: hypothetical protein C4551_07580 [Bacillota bacterium]